jgi:hypothetical protein
MSAFAGFGVAHLQAAMACQNGGPAPSSAPIRKMVRYRSCWPSDIELCA